MQSAKGIKKVDAITDEVNKNGLVVDNLIKHLQELREIAKEEGDPLVVKVLRLVYTYMEDEDVFDLDLLAEEEIEDIEELEEETEEEEQEGEKKEEEEVVIETVEDFEARRENFIYFLGLVRDAENEYNRKELKRIRTFLWSELYGD